MLVYVRYLLFGCGFVVLQYDWESFGHNRNVGVCGVLWPFCFVNGGTISRPSFARMMCTGTCWGCVCLLRRHLLLLLSFQYEHAEIFYLR